MLGALLAGKDAGALFWPIVLVFIGLWFIVGPASEPDSNLKLRFVTDINKHGDWQVEGTEMMAFVHDIDYDLTNATIPPGETNIHLTAFVTELVVRLPDEVGLAIRTNAVVTESNMFGDKQENIMRGLNYTSPDYAQTDRRVRFEINSFVAEIKIF
jgi:lia operon protein LiaF